MASQADHLHQFDPAMQEDISETMEDHSVFGWRRPKLAPSFAPDPYDTSDRDRGPFAHHPPAEYAYYQREPASILSLPSEVIRQIALYTYSPMYLSQQDRTTWSIFSTVDMDPERWANLETLIQFAQTCRKIREVCRVLLFRCIRIRAVEDAREVIRNKDDWGQFVKSIIIDMAMFDPDDDSDLYVPPNPTTSANPGLSSLMRQPGPIRNPHRESALLSAMLLSLPYLEHMSYFADSSDDTTLALTLSPAAGPRTLFARLTRNLRSLGWRQRESPPEGWRNFVSSSIFVSILGLVEQCRQLGFLILDADLTSELGVGAEHDMVSPTHERNNPVDHGQHHAGWTQSPYGNSANLALPQSAAPPNALRKEEGMWEEDIWEALTALEARSHLDRPDDSNSAVDMAVMPSPRDPSRKRLRRRSNRDSNRRPQQFLKMTHVSAESASASPQISRLTDEEGDLTMADSRDSSRPTTASNDDDSTPPVIEMGGAGSDRPVHRLPRHVAGPGASTGLNSRGASILNDASPSPVSLMLCGPIRGWTPSADALAWATRHLQHMYRPEAQERLGYDLQGRSLPYFGTAAHNSGGNHAADISYNQYGEPTSNAPFAQYTQDIRLHAPIGIDSSPISSLDSNGEVMAAVDPTLEDPRPRVFFDGVVERFSGIKELFVDRPVRARHSKSTDVLQILAGHNSPPGWTIADGSDLQAVALLPLAKLERLTLLQIGGYPLTTPDQLLATDMVASLCGRLLFVGWLGLEGETNWYGIWRRKYQTGFAEVGPSSGKGKQKEDAAFPWTGRGSEQAAYEIRPVVDGDLFRLEEQMMRWEAKQSQAEAIARDGVSDDANMEGDAQGSRNASQQDWTHPPQTGANADADRRPLRGFASDARPARPSIHDRGSSTESTRHRLSQLDAGNARR